MANTSELRLYAIVNKEALASAKGNRGKMHAQAGHAFLHAWWDAERRFREIAYRYRDTQAALKIVLAAENAAELQDMYERIKPICGCTLVVDAARTVFAEPTITFLGIGPIAREDAPDWLQALKPLI
jgi:peptidyl-tRNA hydrolase